MDDLEFDQHFADKMRSASAPDLSDEDWGRLSPLLEAEQRQRWRAFPLWWLGALSALLLCSNLGWWWMWQQSDLRTEALRAEWKQIAREQVILRDTTHSKVVVYQYDTIYRTIVYRTIPEGISPITGIVPGLKNAEHNHIPMGSQPDFGSKSGQNASEKPYIDQTTDSLRGSVEPQQRTALPIVVLPPKSALQNGQPRNIHIPETELVVTPPKRVRSPWRPVLLPRKIRVGAGVGGVLPVADNLVSNVGFSTGLTGEFAFSEQLALTLEGAYRGINFKGTVYDEALGLPPHASPGDDYVLKYFELEEEGLKPVLQLTAGMRYWIGAKRSLSPYLGLGYGLQWHLPFELKLEYHNQVTDQEKEFSIEVPLQHKPVSLLDINAGVRYRFLRHLYWQSGGTFQFKTDSNQPGIPYFWELKSSVLYEF